MNLTATPIHSFLKPCGLFAAKCTIRTDDPTRLDMVYHHDSQTDANDHDTRQSTLQSQSAAIEFPGRYSLTSLDEGSGDKAYELNIVANGATGFDITVKLAGNLVARGLAVLDPDDGRSLLISGWIGDVEPYGVAKYTIRDDQTVEGYYLSKMSPDQPGSDKAVGDTTRGFPGRYSLTTLEVNGRTWGPHDWRLSKRGELIDLVWRENGEIICRGFGIFDPRDAQSIIVCYVPVAE